MNFASTLDETIRADLLEWIQTIAQPDARLGGYAICPFAHLASNTTIQNVALMALIDGVIRPPAQPFDVVIYVVSDRRNGTDLDTACYELNERYPDLVFLADARDRRTEINGAVTSNGNHNLILCQPKAKLHQARRALANTRYYQYWDSDYLRKILGEDFAVIMEIDPSPTFAIGRGECLISRVICRTS